MRRWLRKLSRSLNFYSLAGGAGIQALRAWPSVGIFLDHVASIATTHTGIPEPFIHFPLWLAASGVIRVLLGVARAVYNKLWPRTRWLFGYREPLYAVRGDHAFRRDILESLRTSSFMYALLIGGYRLVFEEERFLLEELEKVATTKQFRFLFLDRADVSWNRVAAALFGAENVDSFRRACETADSEIRRRLRLNADQVDYVKGDNFAWRLYIFDDRVYVTRYCMPPESQLLDAKAVPILAFDSRRASTKPMYDWYLAEYRRYCPQWRDYLPTPPTYRDEVQ